MGNILMIIAGTFAIMGLITGFGPFYVSSLLCLLAGAGIALASLQGDVAELERELHCRKRELDELAKEVRTMYEDKQK